MYTMYTMYIYDDNQYPIFEIVNTSDPIYKETVFSATVNEIVSWEADEAKVPLDKELYLTCSIKWDSCAHFWFGEEDDGKQDGYLHLCGREDIDRHINLMKELYNRAFTEMGRSPLEGEDLYERT